MLCIENLKEVGWSKLGENLEEDRRWTKITAIRERRQIQAAVKYYIDNQSKRREHRVKVMASNRTPMRWELNLQKAIRNMK